MRGSFRRGAERRPGGGAPASPRAERAERGNRLPDHHLTYTAYRIPATSTRHGTCLRNGRTRQSWKGRVKYTLTPVLCRGPGVPTCVSGAAVGGVQDTRLVLRGSHHPHVAPGTTCTHLERCTRDPDYPIRRGQFEVIMHMRMRSVNTLSVRLAVHEG
jgi:hypothetical protein